MSERNPYADEARERWGQTDAYKESQRRVNSYGEADWARMQGEQQANVDAFVAALRAGEPSDGDVAKACAEEHRRIIDAWFYPLSYEMQVNLAEMYLADGRFTEFYEKQADGLAQYVHDAILANALGRV
jgi:hypothetical protein